MSQQKVSSDLWSLPTVIVGNTGSGKSSVARSQFVEPMLRAGRRVCIIDPTGVWWGLRLWQNGKKAYEIPVVGGLYGDRAIRPNAFDAKVLAEWVANNDAKRAMVLDLSELLMSERQKFTEEFFITLYKANRYPLQLVIDEADEFAPQNPLPENRRLLHYIDRIVRRGRTRGFRPILITQRPAVLHKNVLSQASVMIAMRLLGSHDRDAVALWVKGNGSKKDGEVVLNSLARLKTGQGWLWAPSKTIFERMQFPMFETFDSSRTPDDDDEPVEPTEAYRSLAATMRELLPPESVGAPANTKAGREAAPAAMAVSVNDVEIKRIESDAMVVGYQKGYEEGRLAAAKEMKERLEGVWKKMENEIIFEKFWSDGKRNNVAVQSATHPRSADGNKLPTERSVTSLVNDNNKIEIPKGYLLSRGAATLLSALAAAKKHKWPTPLSWLDAAMLSGLLSSNGYFYSAKRELEDRGLVTTEGKSFPCITLEGVKIAEPMSIDLETVAQRWIGKLGRPGGDMIRLIVERYQVTKEPSIELSVIGSTLGVKLGNGYWYTAVKKVNSSGVAFSAKGRFILNAVLQELGK